MRVGQIAQLTEKEKVQPARERDVVISQMGSPARRRIQTNQANEIKLPVADSL